MSAVQTRLATLADLDAVAALFDAYRQFYDQAPDLAGARRFLNERLLNNESVLLPAEDAAAGQALGFCQLYPSFCSVEAASIYTLYDLFVVPQARRSGVGRALLLTAEAQAVAGGKVRMDLTTARTNHAAQSMYASLGWVRDDVFLAYSKRLAD
ncbi:GNAT family N-acetyltransferase [Rhodoferax sp. PAMC 29310]|uniref:GNAT family N-acetyltransferase n=1 Tax=Rhodoferax sp. PAMC 29310 TaxID=2822760 RepID=UPI001B32844B|nr:GNAT family N-acetyltransferase [Rhodoferax sp. PAMC 29310]